MSHLRDQVSVLPNKKKKAVKGVVHSENKTKRFFRAALKCTKIGNVFENENSFLNSKIIILLSYDIALSTTTAPSPTSRNFTLNFTLTNLPYTADLDTPSSRKFISTAKVINHYVSPALVLPIWCYMVILMSYIKKFRRCFQVLSCTIFFFLTDWPSFQTKQHKLCLHRM